MKYPSKFPITARLKGGDLNGLVIELPTAFRGVDVERGRKIERFRYGGQDEAGHHFYVFRSKRREFANGAVRLDVGNEAKGAGLGFYP